MCFISCLVQAAFFLGDRRGGEGVPRNKYKPCKRTKRKKRSQLIEAKRVIGWLVATHFQLPASNLSFSFQLPFISLTLSSQLLIHGKIRHYSTYYSNKFLTFSPCINRHTSLFESTVKNKSNNSFVYNCSISLLFLLLYF